MPTTHLVRAKQPTAAGNSTSYPLLGTDLWTFYWIENLHVIPGPLNTELFKDALAQTLSSFPAFAGRLRKPESGAWVVALSPKTSADETWTVPITVAKVAAEKYQAPDTPIQEDLLPYVTHLNIPALADDRADEPLLRIKITQFRTETAIGLMFSHVIADGAHSLKFTRLLSSHYQALLKPPKRFYQKPTPYVVLLLLCMLLSSSYSLHKGYPLRDVLLSLVILAPLPPVLLFISSQTASQDKGSNNASDIHIHTYSVPKPLAALAQISADNEVRAEYPLLTTNLHDWTNFLQSYQTDFVQSARVDVHLNPSHMQKLKDLASKGLSISHQDAISAYIVEVINRHVEKPVTVVRNNFNFRDNVDAEHVGGNAIMSIQTDKIEGSEALSIPAIAAAIRRSVNLAKDREEAVRRLPYLNYFMLEAANNNVGQCMLPEPSQAYVNSNLQYDWNAAHFGHRGRARFYTAWCGDRYIRVLRSNPKQNPDGSWDPRKGHVDIAFKVPKGMRERVVAMVARDLAALDRGEAFVRD